MVCRPFCCQQFAAVLLEGLDGLRDALLLEGARGSCRVEAIIRSGENVDVLQFWGSKGPRVTKEFDSRVAMETYTPFSMRSSIEDDPGQTPDISKEFRSGGSAITSREC